MQLDNGIFRGDRTVGKDMYKKGGNQTEKNRQQAKIRKKKRCFIVIYSSVQTRQESMKTF